MVIRMKCGKFMIAVMWAMMATVLFSCNGGEGHKNEETSEGLHRDSSVSLKPAPRVLPPARNRTNFDLRGPVRCVHSSGSEEMIGWHRIAENIYFDVHGILVMEADWFSEEGREYINEYLQRDSVFETRKYYADNPGKGETDIVIYNSQDEATYSFRKYPDGTGYESFTCNDEERKLEEWRTVDLNGRPKSRHVYLYDEGGNNISYTIYDEKDRVSEVTIYKYNAQNKETLNEFRDGRGKLIHKREREYDSRGNMTRDAEYGWVKEKFREVHYFRYDDRNRMIHKKSMRRDSILTHDMFLVYDTSAVPLYEKKIYYYRDSIFYTDSITYFRDGRTSGSWEYVHNLGSEPQLSSVLEYDSLPDLGVFPDLFTCLDTTSGPDIDASAFLLPITSDSLLKGAYFHRTLDASGNLRILTAAFRDDIGCSHQYPDYQVDLRLEYDAYGNWIFAWVKLDGKTFQYRREIEYY